MTKPQPFPLAALIVPISLLAIRPEALKKATPASASVEPDSIVTPEISTYSSSYSVEPSDCRDTVITLPPPSRRVPVAPPSDVTVDFGLMVTSLAPAPMIFNGFLIVRPFVSPAADTGFSSLLTGVDDS